MENKTYTSFLGTGWAFPPTFTKDAKGAELVSDEEDIRQSLRILMSTRLDERAMRLDYGCNLDRLLFEPLSTNLQTYVKDLIKTSILRYEPRIVLNKIEIDSKDFYDGLLLIKLNYTISQTNSRYNFVYPFYLNEATNVDR